MLVLRLFLSASHLISQKRASLFRELKLFRRLYIQRKVIKYLRLQRKKVMI